jgi:hypothetical protein
VEAESGDEALGDGLTCFIISPIGNKLAPPGTGERSIYEDSIQMWEDVFQPAAEQFGMMAIRADTISETGEIPEQICVLLRDADVVIADLTGGNPNVMYELGLRHTRDKLTVPVGEHARLPFDINTIRTVQFKRTESGRIELRRALVDMLREGLSGKRSPVTATRVWMANPAEPSIAGAVLASLEKSTDPEAEPIELGFLDVLAEGERAMTEVTAVIERASAAIAAMGTIYTLGAEDVGRSDASGKGFAGRLIAAKKLADELSPPADEYEEASSEYVELLNLVDAEIKYLVGSVKGGQTPLDDVRGFLTSVVELADIVVDQNVPVMTTFRESNKTTSKISRVLQPVTRKVDRSILRFLNGAEVTDGWRKAIEDLPEWS